MLKLIVGIFSAILGFAVFAVLGPGFNEPFDYDSASPERRQEFLEKKARRFEAGFRVTAGKSSEISNIFVDEAYDLVSISVKLRKDSAENLQFQHVAQYREFMLEKSCQLTERKLLTDTPYTMRIRFFKPSGAKLMTVEINGESCKRFLD